MEQNLKTILDFIQQSENLTADLKDTFSKTIKDVEKELAITTFKLERTEKVKRTTAILLEETIEELEQKRKAVEAQNRELEIEASLERVRLSAMSMHTSNDVGNATAVLFSELENLGIKTIRCGIIIGREEEEKIELWTAASLKEGQVVQIIGEVDVNIHPLLKGSFDAWLQKKDFFSFKLEGENKELYYQSLATSLNYPISNRMSSLPDHFCTSFLFQEGGLFAFSFETFSPENSTIFKKFANVFSQTYRLFLDLQKAEAQAREAQIEAGLERFRSRMLGMQKSSELEETTAVMHQQMSALGIVPEGAMVSIVIIDRKTDTAIQWIVSDQKLVRPPEGELHIPMNQHPQLIKTYEAWKRKEPMMIRDISREEMKDFRNYFLSLPSFQNLKSEIDLWPDRLVWSEASFSNGTLGLIYIEPLPQATLDILIRFARVFDLTYTRFLDIQKAEEQAREAQIQLALERIRARTMAMQRSDELAETAAILFEQFIALGEMPERMAIEIVNEAEHVFEIWATEHGGKHFNSLIKTSLDEPYVMQKMYRAWMERTKSITIDLQGNELEEYFKFLKKMKLPVDRKIFGKRRVQNVATFSKGILTIITPEPRPRETIDILERFAAVFDGTYTRFLDLQKAEAQAREAQIESSLERVRSKTMAMHNSKDVGDTVASMFDEFVKLDIETNRCGILIFSESIQYSEVWTAKSNPDGKAILITGHLDMATHPLLEGAFRDWKNKKPVHVYPMLGNDLRNYYQTIKDSKYYPTLFDMDSLPAKEFHSDFYFAEGAIFAFTNEPIPDEATLIFKRFAGVFGQTYRRYLDLRKAEAQARESQIEASLERVRSRTLAMQKSNELAETSAVVFRQLINLGIAPNRLYIAIINDQSGDLEFWITDEDGTKISKQFTGNKSRNPTIQTMYEGWSGQKKSITIDMQGEELSAYFHYLSDELKVPFKLGFSQKRRVQSIAYFAKGFIGMASPDEQPDETILLLERFAAVFNLTFTRFNDLKIAEAHAEQAELDLIKLREEKQRTEEALTELKSTQAQLIQSEKMASLGELTAGIAHEIQNPLNFVNNFSEVSNELIVEIEEERAKKPESRDEKLLTEILSDIKQNLEKINHHGKRAADIVRGMLQHSRSSSGVKEPTDINALADEYLRLAYHGLRAKDKSFNATMKTDFDESIGKINIIPQDIGRVILNLITNAFYVVNEKNASTSSATGNYEPTVSVSTRRTKDKVEVFVKDNGNGIPQNILDKVFQPFFTTKPTGEGTGLGLSLSYDIVKAHGGELKVDTKEGEGSELIIRLPINS